MPARGRDGPAAHHTVSQAAPIQQHSTTGFGTGVRALLRGWAFLFRTPASWPYAWVPAAILSVLLVAWSWVTLVHVVPAISQSLPEPSGKLSELVWQAASGLLALGVYVLGLFLTVALAPPLSGPALEKIVALQEQALSVPPRQPLGLWAEIWCGFRAQIFVLLWIVPAFGLLWSVELLLPALAALTVPLKLVVTSLALAWNLLDYPLTLRGVRMRERFQLFVRHKLACLGFGAAFSLLFWIPCGCQIVLLPVGAAAATDLVWQLLGRDPGLLPELTRPAPAPVRDGTSSG